MFSKKIFTSLFFIFFCMFSGATQTVDLGCQDETDGFIGLDRKNWNGGSTAFHSEGTLHNFDLPINTFGPCKTISNIEITFNVISVDYSNLAADCPQPTDFYVNMNIGCPSTAPASCDESNLVYQSPNPDILNLPTINISSPPEDFPFGEVFSVDIVPVMNTGCSQGQSAISSGGIVLDFEICVIVTITDEVIDTPPELGAGPTVCPNATTILDPGSYTSYEWGPNGEITSTIDVGPGNYTVTVTDANGCTGTDDIIVSTHPLSLITFDPVAPSVCDDGFSNVMVNESYNSYAWSNGLFGQTVSLSTGLYDVTISDNNNCSTVDVIEVTNTPPPNAGIDNFLDVCNDGTTYDIEALLLTFDAGGIWNDDDFSGININTSPNSVSFSNAIESTYTYTYTAMGNAPCPSDEAIISVQVFNQNFAGFSDVVQYCADPDFQDFYFLIGNPDIGGIWTDNGPTGVDLSDPFSVNLNGVPAGSYDFDYLLTSNGACQSESATLTVVILDAAFAGNDNFATVCEGTQFNLNDLIDGANTTGTFSDTDGSGVLTGSTVNTNGLAGLSFDYTYSVGSSSSPCGMDDAVHTIYIKSSVSAGDNNSESLCIGGDINLTTLLLNEDAGGLFVDLDISGGLVGNILNTDDITAGTYTYQYAVGDGNTCPKDSSQIILTFISRPLLDIEAEEITICESQCQDIVFNLIGTPPFSFPIEIYSPEGLLVANDTINTLTNSYKLITCNTNDTIGFTNDSLSLLTDSAWILTIPSLMDLNCSFIFSNDADTLDIFTYQNAIFSLDTVACLNDTLTISGTEFYVGNDSYQDTIPGSRCDSIISIMVNFQDVDTVFINTTICAGDSTMIGSMFYGENNPTDDIIVINPNGCDSITIINISFYSQVDSLLTVPLCAGESTNINGTLYDDTNMSGSDTLFNQSLNGCDSIVIVQIMPTTGITIERNDTLCMEESILIGGQTFDFSNQTDQVILSGAGCDTTIFVALNFYSIDEGIVSGIFCPDYEIEINGNTYDFNNRIGIEPFPNGSQAGCDSILNINLDFETPIITPYTDDICGDEFIEVNGTIYDRNNLSNTEVFVGGSISGCDSTVIVTLNWSPIFNESSVALRCEGDSIFLAGAFQFVSGTYIDTFQSIGMCDSIISTEITFMSCIVEVVVSTTSNICAGDSEGGFSIDIISTIDIPYTITWIGQNSGITDQIIIGSSQNMVNVTNLSSDTYIISISDMDGTTIYQETIEVLDINPPLVGTWIEVESILCFDSLGSIEFIVTGGMPSYSYSWNQSNIENTAIAENLVAGDYSLTVTDQNGCTTDTSYALVNPEELSFISNTLALSCDGSNDGQIMISNIIGGQGPYNVSINDVIIMNFLIDSLQAGVYEIIVEDKNGCTQTMIEEILSDGNLDFATYQMEYTITVGDSLSLLGTITEDNVTYAWTNSSSLSCIDCATPVATPSSSTSYDITITNQQGCSQLITILVTVEDIEQVFQEANIFSPNGDNINDRLIFDYGSEKVLVVEIFDRWGNRVFQEELIDGVISWDGIYNGNLLANGVYVYHVQITDSEGNTESKLGDVMLLR